MNPAGLLNYHSLDYLVSCIGNVVLITSNLRSQDISLAPFP